LVASPQKVIFHEQFAFSAARTTTSNLHPTSSKCGRPRRVVNLNPTKSVLLPHDSTGALVISAKTTETEKRIGRIPLRRSGFPHPNYGNPDGATGVSAGGLMWNGRSASEWGGG
jgi:hypothetical protein